MTTGTKEAFTGSLLAGIVVLGIGVLVVYYVMGVISDKVKNALPGGSWLP